MTDFDVTKDTWLRREELSIDRVRRILETAEMSVCEVDTDLDSLMVKNKNGDLCHILNVNPESAVIFSRPPVQFKDRVTRSERLECANTINASFMGVRAYINEDEYLTFGHELCMPAGLPETVFILEVMGFCVRVREAIEEHALPLLETD
jgi:hypothetical protein